MHETWLRLLQTLQTTQPCTVADFFRLAAHKIRQVLLDLADRQRKLANGEAFADGSVTQANEVGQNTYDPGKLAVWTDFHEHVERLADDERAVFEMH